MARHSWPGEDAIGKRLRLLTASGATRWFAVVGVLADARQRSWKAPPENEMYFPFWQDGEPAVADLGRVVWRLLNIAISRIPARGLW